MTHQEKAMRLLHQQYHCSQALFGAFAEDFDLDLKDALKVSTCFGGGMRQGSVCGCITAAMMVLGMAIGFYDPQDRELEVYGNKKTKEFVQRFDQRMDGRITCRDILGRDITKPDDMIVIRRDGLMMDRCPQAIACSIEILEDMLGEYLDKKEKSAIDLELLHQNINVDSVLKALNERRKFRANVNELVFSSPKHIAFIQFDISRFKIINDLYGEKFGDQILEFVLRQLGDICTKGQLFSNLRSDVFMVVMEFDQEEELTGFICQLDGRIRRFKDVQLQMSYGIYIVQDRHMEHRQMEDRSAMARRAAKDNFLTNITFYREQFKETLYNRKFVEENMQSAIGNGQIQMYLQPKYSITRNAIVGAEALIRWHHPERGMIAPDEFIPILEENGFIQRADYFIWEEAAGFLRRCQEAGIEPCPVSVNMSRVHLKDDACLQVLSELIARMGISKSLLELEITETAGDQQIRRKAMQLKEEGFVLLMDDFGSGYSSLNVLLETPFDVIKLDKKFIENMMVSNKGRLILEQVVTMADKLGLGLLAEGVETQEQVELLRSIGCDQVQGYYYAKPMPPDDFFTLLKEQRGPVV